MNTDYLLEIKRPTLSLLDCQNEAEAEQTVDQYLWRLEELRLSFVEYLSTCRESVALAYYDELITLKKALMYIGSDKENISRVCMITWDISDYACPWREGIQRIKEGVLHSINITLDFLRTLSPKDICFNNKRYMQVRTAPSTSKEERTLENMKPRSELAKKLDEYQDLLSVKDLTTIFGCTPRTITNWEEKGWIINIAETSDEVNSLGRKKRGREKRYRKDTILRSIVLQERYRSMV